MMHAESSNIQLGEAQTCWGSAAVVHGWRDVSFLRRHRGDLEERLVGRGLTHREAEWCVTQRINSLPK